MWTTSKSNRSSARAQRLGRHRDPRARSPSAPSRAAGSGVRSRPSVRPPAGGEHEAGLDRVEDGEVELGLRARRSGRSGASRCPPMLSGGPCSRCSTWGRFGSRSARPSSSAAKVTASGSRRRSWRLAARNQRKRSVQEAGGVAPVAPWASVAEGHVALVVDVGRVLDQVAHAQAARPQAEVDLLAVAPAVGLLVERPAAVAGGPGHVHAEPDAGDDLGAQSQPSTAPRRPRTRRCGGRRPVQPERLDHRRRKGADRALVGQRGHGGHVVGLWRRRAMRSSQPSVTTVSALSRTTSPGL